MILRKSAVFAAGILTVLGYVAAEARPAIYSMNCEQARAFVQQRGAVVVDTGPHTFERIVVDRSYCLHGENVRTFYTRTTDNPKCNVGRECFRKILRPTQ